MLRGAHRIKGFYVKWARNAESSGSRQAAGLGGAHSIEIRCPQGSGGVLPLFALADGASAAGGCSAPAVPFDPDVASFLGFAALAPASAGGAGLSVGGAMSREST